MDPITILQNRIEQLEAKLGVAAMQNSDAALQQQAYQQQQQAQQHHQHTYQQQQAYQQQGDSAAVNLVNAQAAINNISQGHEKIAAGMQRASELNNYIDPNQLQNMNNNQMHMQEVIANEPVIQHHCKCMHQCKQATPVLESEPIQQVPQMQAAVENMQAAAAAAKTADDNVARGVQELAETCGAAAQEASEQIAQVAQKVDQAQERLFVRRNGLD